MRLFFILPGFVNFSGHDISFINTLSSFAKKNKLELKVISSDKNYIKINVDHHKVISDYGNNFFSKLLNILIVFFNFKKFLKSHNFNFKDKVLIDGGSHYQQLGVALSFLIYKKKVKKIFIYYRIINENNFIKKILLRFIFFSLKKASYDLIILTDSAALGTSLNQNYNYKNYVMPIPHLFSLNLKSDINKNKDSVIKLWLPGPIRKDKGLDNLKELIENIRKLNLNITIYINEKSKMNFNSHDRIVFLKSNMSREEYISYFEEDNIIILPYSDPSYKTRTSGIFLESVSAGKKVIVSSETYMADELIRYGLEQLVVEDWSSIQVLDQINNVFINKKLELSLLKMKKEYAQKHGDDAYQIKLKEIFN